MNISATVKTIQDIMRKDAGVDGDAQRIAQVAWMLFLMVFDSYEQEYESQNNHYVSPLAEPLRWRNWTANAQLMSDRDLVDFVNQDLLEGLRNLPFDRTIPMTQVIRSVFQGVYNYMESGALLRQVIGKIAQISLGTKDRHLIGDIYERILQDLKSAGNAGEYYTPRAITEFVVRVVDPKRGENILDPACGTGGFLASSINHVRRQYAQTADCEDRLQHSIFGIEKKPFPHLLCTTNMLLHGIRVPNQIQRDNALTRPLDSYGPQEAVDVIVTNPPFGGWEGDEIGANSIDGLRSRETADLFLILIIGLLKDGGRAAVVLPDGFLFGDGVKARIRKYLLENCRLHTIVRLPGGVFSPYTDIKTNILFFTKGEPTDEIWFYEHPYPSGYRSYSKKKPIRIEEFEQEVVWWKHRVGNEYAWRVTIDQIEANNYNLDLRNPHDCRVLLGNPREALDGYQKSLRRIGRACQSFQHEFLPSLREKQYKYLDVLVTHFQVLVETPGAIPALRKLVLRLAMKGQLVPPNPADEPVAALGQRILSASGPAKQTAMLHALSPVDEEKAPFLLPPHWRWVRLGDIVQVVGGGTPSTACPEYYADIGIPWLTPADLAGLKGKFIGKGRRDLSELGLQRSSARLLPRGTVLFSSRAPIGYVAIAANELATNQGFKSCVPFLMEMNEFIYYFLVFAGDDINRNAPGTTFREVSGKLMRQILCPLPPIEEQQRIVKKLDMLMLLLEELETELQVLAANRTKLTHSLLGSTDGA